MSRVAQYPPGDTRATYHGGFRRGNKSKENDMLWKRSAKLLPTLLGALRPLK